MYLSPTSKLGYLSFKKYSNKLSLIIIGLINLTNYKLCRLTSTLENYVAENNLK